MKRQIHLKIALLRKNRKMTQQELGDAIGVSYQTISKWENGVTMPDIGMLPELAEHFHVTVDELLGLKPLEGEAYLPAKTDTKEFWAHKFDYLMRTRKTQWNKDYMKFLIDQVWKLDSPVKVLDCGCGYGELGLLMMPLLPEGSTYTGVDFTEELIIQGKELFLRTGVQGTFVTADFFQFPLTYKFDVVICQSVLRHVSQPEHFLTKMIGHGSKDALIISINTNREFECDGLYVEGMEYSYLCEHSGLEKFWKKEFESEGRDYAAAIRTAHHMRKSGLKDIEVRMNDRISFVHPEMDEYEQIVEDFLECNGLDCSYHEETLERTEKYMVNHGMSIKEAESFLRKKQVLTDYFNQNQGMVSYTQVLGRIITLGRKSSDLPAHHKSLAF
jgi:2-polyprenyl-3-methyl-5-hydroxy-6-metoxy-1,4-benzoquinol methylase/DNA-binding XRE family transcriptional regulator